MKIRFVSSAVLWLAGLAGFGLGAPEAWAQCETSCSVQCEDGYWSSIGCYANECAYCDCPPPPRCELNEEPPEEWCYSSWDCGPDEECWMGDCICEDVDCGPWDCDFQWNSCGSVAWCGECSGGGGDPGGGWGDPCGEYGAYEGDECENSDACSGWYVFSIGGVACYY